MAPTNRTLLFVSLSLALVFASSLARTPRVHAEAEHPDAELLGRAMRARVSIATERRTGRTIPAHHCRHAPEGCERRLMEFAHYITEAGQRNGIDPWLLAAMAFKESGFNPFAMGSLGELGVLQLHPKNPRSRHVRFVHDESYRRRCRKTPGACQREVVDRAAQVLADSVQMCGGDLSSALGAYNTGRCGGHQKYANRILGERKALREAAGLSG